MTGHYDDRDRGADYCKSKHNGVQTPPYPSCRNDIVKAKWKSWMDKLFNTKDMDMANLPRPIVPSPHSEFTRNNEGANAIPQPYLPYHFNSDYPLLLFVGALGGTVSCGQETGLFCPYFGAAAKSVPLSKRLSGLLIAVTGQALVAGLIFNALGSKIEEYRQKKDWKNFASAGFLSGALLGAHGGVRMVANASFSFGLFTTMMGSYWQYKDYLENKLHLKRRSS